VTWSSEWQVILQVKPRRLAALPAQEHGSLCLVSHLVNHDVPQQANHRVPLLWGVVHNVSPYFVELPDTLKSVSFVEKDSKRFPNTSGWGYAQFL
jgi:hypothetical protein